MEINRGQIIKEAYLPVPNKAKGLVKDVSENGVGLYTDEEFEVGDGMFFDIPSLYGNLSVKAQVIRKLESSSAASRFRFYYGCVLTQSDRRLLHFIFEIQRERLKIQRAMVDE